MDLAAVFAGLDRIAWSELHHAYGPAEDVPDLLRALTASTEEAAAEAEQELWGSLVHQGSVYEATVAAVPFLARLAAAGVRRASLLGMLGAVAESTDEHGLDREGAARAAVVAQLPSLLPSLADAVPEVRQCAAWAVARCGRTAGPDTRAALRRRWESETDPVVRADVLTACVRVDPDAAEGMAAIALRPRRKLHRCAWRPCWRAWKRVVPGIGSWPPSWRRCRRWTGTRQAVSGEANR
ncbi:hypothetical protein [Streptomyces virginiae]|uniref:hypothetical protein n=1 Tax=Streptomyces virginiae TaxID=1961 RepID=UPI0022539087|nr:hypothetical protein [Streptomyces virginiae]MCX5275460.1 hypothetical protein [Streptomyces virginiae]